ncbi:hypothetical protein ACP70R_024749 [Stipagrostis hirtigluma subsp. patula]
MRMLWAWRRRVAFRLARKRRGRFQACGFLRQSSPKVLLGWDLSIVGEPRWSSLQLQQWLRPSPTTSTSGSSISCPLSPSSTPRHSRG